jgi:translation elongation factor EF-Tu-like GTPase
MPQWDQFKAQVRFLMAEEGGRTGATVSGYRPTCDFGLSQDDGQKIYNDALLFLDGADEARPGETREVRVVPLHPELLGQVIRPGLTFDVTEGGRLVGKGTVLKRLA